MSCPHALSGLAVAAALLPAQPPSARPSPAAAPPVGVQANDPRPQIEAFQRILDLSVRKVSRPSAATMAGTGEGCRGYQVQGFGAMFVLTPRSLPPPKPRETLFPPPPHGEVLEAAIRAMEDVFDRVESPALRAEMRKRLQALRQMQASSVARDATPPRRPAEQDELRAAEERVKRLEDKTREAEQQAAQAMEQMGESVLSGERPVIVSPKETPGTADAAPAAAPQAAAAAALLQAAPPWELLMERDDDEQRTPEAVIRDVRAALTDALEAHGARLRMVAPDEYIAVAVDFFNRPPFGSWQRPERTLVVRIRKRELDERLAGKITPQELRSRVEYEEY